MLPLTFPPAWGAGVVYIEIIYRSNLMESSVQIIKFGGTSVGSGERIRHVANIIAHKLNDPGEAFPIVVVSAMSGVTDQLLRIARLACTGEHQHCTLELSALKQKHIEAAEKAIHNHETLHSLLHNLETAFSAFYQTVLALQPAALITTKSTLDAASILNW